MIHNDVLSVEMNDAFAVYVASLCFEMEFMHALGVKLNCLPHLQHIATLQEFPKNVVSNFVLESVEELTMTWGKAKVYFYKRMPD